MHYSSQADQAAINNEDQTTPFRGWHESSRELMSGLTVRELDPGLSALFFRLLGAPSEGGGQLAGAVLH